MDWETFSGYFDSLPIFIPPDRVEEGIGDRYNIVDSDGELLGFWYPENDWGTPDIDTFLFRRTEPEVEIIPVGWEASNEFPWLIISEEGFVVFKPLYDHIVDVVETFLKAMGAIELVPSINDWHPSEIAGELVVQLRSAGIKLSYPVLLLVFFSVLWLKDWLLQGVWYEPHRGPMEAPL